MTEQLNNNNRINNLKMNTEPHTYKKKKKNPQIVRAILKKNKTRDIMLPVFRQ